MLTIAFQMDPLSSINIECDSTFLIAQAAQRRGHRLYHYLPSALTLHHNHLFCRGCRFEIQTVPESPFRTGTEELLDLSCVDVILMRQDPPFNLAYITATHLLEHLPVHVLVINDPVSVRNAPEKLLITYFPELMPPTLITQDMQLIVEFRKKHSHIIVKPLYTAGGVGVFHVSPEDENLSTILEVLTSMTHEPVIVQKYLPEIKNGDKRIILFDGNPVGAVVRMPRPGEARANFHAGGTPLPTTLTPRDLEICHQLGPMLRERNLLFVGIDVIGDYLTEINVTSPTCLQEIKRFEGIALEDHLLDVIETRVLEKKHSTLEKKI